MENHFRIVIENGGKKIELESSDKEWVEKKQKELVKMLDITSTQPTVGAKKSSASPEHLAEKDAKLGKATINEFYREYCAGIKTNTDLAVFFIYYMIWVEKKKEISTGDVKERFIKVGIPRANALNYTDILYRAKKRALLSLMAPFFIM